MQGPDGAPPTGRHQGSTKPTGTATGAPKAAGCFFIPLHKKKAAVYAAATACRKTGLTPLFRDFHGALAPTARAGRHAGKPLLRKAFCGFAVHPQGGLLLSLRDNSPCAAKADESLRGGKAERRQWREERGGSPVSKGAPGRPHGPTQRELCELHCGPRTPRGFSTGWGSGPSAASFFLDLSFPWGGYGLCYWPSMGLPSCCSWD